MIAAEILAKRIDHTFLKPVGGTDAVEKLCYEAVRYGFCSVMVNPANVAAAKAYVGASKVKVGTVVSFPLGQSLAPVKTEEARCAIGDGADELDYVVNIPLLKAAHGETVRHAAPSALLKFRDELLMLNGKPKEIKKDIVTKLIIETCYLTDDEKIFACKEAAAAGFDFVKTSTGFGSLGATAPDVALMKKAVEGKALVKAAGGIRDLETALEMINAGADRLGCSESVKIMEALEARHS